MKKRYLLVGFVGLLVFAFLFKKPLLQAVGGFLIYENELPDKASCVFVLSGGSLDRGNKAYELSTEIEIDSIICTGENIPPDLKVIFNDSILESDLTAWQILQLGYDSSKIRLIRKGTSTAEESEIILKYCLKHQLSNVIIVSSKFHTRRIKQVFLKKFKKENIDIYISGAPSSNFNEDYWWKDEYGLIAVNNEYIKQLFYLFTE